MIYDLELNSKITAQFNGQSVIDYLTGRFTYKNREKWLELINSGGIKVNNKRINSDYLLEENDDLTFIVNNYFEPDLDSNYHKVFENENII